MICKGKKDEHFLSYAHLKLNGKCEDNPKKTTKKHGIDKRRVIVYDAIERHANCF